MGLKKKLKKAKKTATTVHKNTMRVANNPIVKTAVTAVATAYAGPAGAAAVQGAYGVVNTVDAKISSASKKYKELKGQYSALSAVTSVNNASKSLVNGVVKVSTKVRKKSFIDRIFEFFGL